MWHKLRLATAILLIPLFEFLFFRYLLHYPLGVRIGFYGMVVSDLIYPGFLAYILLISVLHAHSAFRLTLQKTTLHLHLILLSIFSLSTFFFTKLSVLFPQFFLSVWLGLAFVTFGSALFLFFSFKRIFQFPYPQIYLPITLLAFSKLITAHLMQPAGENLQFASAWSTAGILKIFSSSIQVLDYEIGGKYFLQLVHPQHTLAVGIGCSGLDGILLLLFALTVTWIMEIKKLSPGFWIFFMALGSVCMYTVNLFRLLVLFLLPIGIQNLTGSYSSETGEFLALLHDPFGWISYLIAIWVFYKYVVRVALQIKDGNLETI